MKSSVSTHHHCAVFYNESMPFSYDIDPDESARAKRRIKSQPLRDIEVKALGSNLGQIARGQAVYDPNAYDGDGDGVVQDSTPFERPAVLSNIASLARGLASATGRWGDDYQNWTVGKTNEEIAEVAVPDNPADLLSYIAIHASTRGLPRIYASVDDLLSQTRQSLLGVDLSPETVANTRKVLVDALNNNPQMRELIDRFGIPPMVTRKNKPEVSGAMTQHMLMTLSKEGIDEYTGGKRRGKGSMDTSVLSRLFGDDIDKLSDLLPDDFASDEFMVSTFIHEYGHYLFSYASYNHPDPKVREMLYVINNSPWNWLSDPNNINRYDLPIEWYDLATLLTSGHTDIDPDDEYNIEDYVKPDGIVPPSKYALTSPSEMVAELFTESILDPRTDNRSTEILRTITGRKTTDKGFASVTLPGTRWFDDKSIEDIVDAVVPSTPEKAREELEAWSQWMFDLSGPGYFDVDTEGMTPSEKVNLELKRLKFHIDKKMAGNYNRVLRKARRYKGEVKPEEVFDFSEEALMGLRNMVSEALNNSPEFLSHVRDFGMPPLFVTKGEVVPGAIFNGSTGALFITMNKLSLDPTPLENPDDARAGKGKKLAGTEWYLESNGNWKPESILFHEFGHFVNYLSSNLHPDRETRYLAMWYWRMSWGEGNGWRMKRKWKKFRKENPGYNYDAADKRWLQVEEIRDAIDSSGALDWENGPPHVLSQYGQQNPAETFAEGYAAWVSGDAEQMARVSPALVKDIKMHVTFPTREETTTEVDLTQAMQRPTGLASLSIKRNEDGTRDLAAALDGSSPSPLDGSNWLKDATPKEIAQAIVPRTREDAVNLALMNLLAGNRNPDTMTMAAMRSILSKMLDTDIFDFSPEGVSQMEKWIEKALDESPQFLWQVRRFGSLPMIPTDRNAVRKYRDALENGTPIPIRSMNGARIEAMTYPFTSTNLSAEQEVMQALFDGSVANPGVMGYCVGSLFMVMNMHHREWRGVWDPQKSPPPKFGRTRRVLMGVGKTPGELRPFPEKDKYGRFLISNFGTSLEGTIIHEWAHGWFSSLFGPKQGLAIVPDIRDEVAIRGGVTKKDLYRFGGNRDSRYAYFFPDLSRDEAEARVEFAQEFLSPGSLSIIPVPESHRDVSNLSHFMGRAVTKAQAIYGPNSPEVAEITQRMNDYGQELYTRGITRIATIANAAGVQVEDIMVNYGVSPYDMSQVQPMAMFFGYEPGINQDVWQDFATDFPDIFGDSSLPFSTLAGQYAQKNPQETWAELNIQMAQPDSDYRDEYITPELRAALLYVLGEHSDPFDTNITNIPWETRGGFASRTQKVEHARATVIKRSSNTLGNVISSRSTDDRASRVIKSTRDERGHTHFEIGDYTFTIPGDKFMPDLSSAYTEWASESHYGIQQMSRMMMGVQPSRNNPLSMPGNTEINAIRSGRGVSKLDERMLSSIRSTASKTNRILDEIRDGDSYSSMPLYHAVNAVEQDSDILGASIGDTISMPLSSFSPNFFNPDMVTNRGSGDSSAVIKLSIGAKVMNSNLLENTNRNGEWRDVPIESITGGKFKVISKGERNGIPVIEIEHTDVFDTTSGEWMNVDPTDAMSSIRYEVLTDRGMKELEKLNKRRMVLKDGDPEYGNITEEMDTVAKDVVRSMFGGNTDPVLPVLGMSREDRIKFEEQMDFLSAIPVSSMDKRGLPGFASVSDANMAFSRRITPERRVAKSAIRMLQDNREYIADRMIPGTNREILDDVWVDKMLEKLNNGEITHADGMNIMNVIMDLISDRIKRDPSSRDATDGDVYHYQKLGKRLRRAMTAEVTTEETLNFSKASGFASSTINTDKRVTERFNPTVISTKADEGEWGEFETSRTIVQANVYEIDGEKVAFGIEERHGLDTTGINVIELNPYVITGLERGTPEGEEMALDWIYADTYLFETGSGYNHHNGTEISALLYAATKGDKEAEKQFKEYAEKGRALIAQKRQEEMDKERETFDGRLSDAGVRGAIKSLQTRIAAVRRKNTDGYYGGDISEQEIADAKVSPENLVLVRWSQFPPEYDDEGNLIIHPASKYLPVDRETIHFTLNHAVEEHMFWTEGDEGGYLITVPLQDVIDANGIESLDNLYAIDTYFTPKQGKGLKLPKAKVRKVEKGEDRKAITRELMETEYNTLGIAGGPHYAETSGFDDAVRLVARDLDIPPGTIHASQPHKQFEQFNNYTDGNGERNLAANENNQQPFTFSNTIATMERNALLAIADRQHAKWSGVNEGRVVNPKGSFVSVSRSRTRSDERLASLNNAEEIKVIDSIQKRIGFASRTDAVNPRGKTNEQIVEELELTENEKEVLSRLLPDYEELEALLVNPAITQEQRQRIIDSVRVRIEDGVPFITTDPHPLVVDEIPDKRDWSTVLAPSRESQLEIINFLEKVGERLEVTESIDFPYRTTAEPSPSVDETKLNIVGFSTWLMEKWRAIADRHPVPPGAESDGSSIYGGGYVPTGFTIYFKSLFNMNETAGILDFFGEEDFLNAHDLWGHAAIGRGFDRHGEWANMLAIFSMMDRWSEENDIPESAILRMKAKWFHGVEYSRFDNRFNVYWLENNTENAINRQFRMTRVLEGVATDDELRELIALLDTGRVHDSANSRGFASATRDERASIVANDIVRQSRRLVEMDLTDSGSETGAEIAKEMGLTGKAARIAKEAFQRTLESISNGTFRKYKMAKGVDEHKSRLLDSIRIVISADDVPMIMADPHPVFFRLLTDRRDWSKIEIPSNATINEFVKRLKEGNNPLYRRGIQQRTDENTGYQKFNKWAFEKLLPLINATERQEYGERTNPEELDLDDELMVLSGNESWASLYIGSLFDGESAIGNSLIEAFDALHEAVGHVAIGRGFDRHGEYANALAVLSLFRQPELQELLTKGEIQELLGKIMTDYLAGPIGLATREQSNVLEDALNAVNHDIKMSPTGELMQLITDYEGDLFELIDLLESEIDKTPALREDGSPLESRPTGFASISRLSLQDVKPEVRDEIAIADAVHLSPKKKTSKPAGFASRAVDFKQGTHNIEVIDNAPEADMFTADERGHTVQVFVPEGVEVINPRTGKKMVLDSPGASVAFVEDGGNLSEVPDAHAIEAILNNAENVPGERRSGWRFSKPDGRFEWLGGGGGAHGMMRIKDRRTNLIFGIKFEASFMAPEDDKYGEWTSPFPITETAVADAPEGIVNEVVGQAVLQALGFEPGATRVVKRSTRGAGDKNGGAALIVEFAQNRYNRIRYPDDYAPMTVRKESAIRMLLLDAILANTDRNPNNFLTSIQSDGTRVIIPIDHGQIMTSRVNKFDLKGGVSSQIGWNAVQYEKILEDMTRAELIAIMPSILADYRADIEQKKADIVKAMNQAVDKLISLHEDGEWPDMDYLGKLSEEYDNRLKAVFSRLDEVASMSDEDFLELFKYLKFGYK
jgi:hypothetical protein